MQTNSLSGLPVMELEIKIIAGTSSISILDALDNSPFRSTGIEL